MPKKFTLESPKDQLEIKNHEPGSGRPDKYEYFGRKICWNCGDDMKKYKDVGQGEVWSCTNPSQEEKRLNQGGCMRNYKVYFNHCCDCGSIIDSRYCRESKEEGSYYCAVCGSLCDKHGNVIRRYDPEENDTYQDSDNDQGHDEHAPMRP